MRAEKRFAFNSHVEKWIQEEEANKGNYQNFTPSSVPQGLKEFVQKHTEYADSVYQVKRTIDLQRWSDMLGTDDSLSHMHLLPMTDMFGPFGAFGGMNAMPMPPKPSTMPQNSPVAASTPVDPSTKISSPSGGGLQAAVINSLIGCTPLDNRDDVSDSNILYNTHIELSEDMANIYSHSCM